MNAFCLNGSVNIVWHFNRFFFGCLTSRPTNGNIWCTLYIYPIPGSRVHNILHYYLLCDHVLVYVHFIQCSTHVHIHYPSTDGIFIFHLFLLYHLLIFSRPSATIMYRCASCFCHILLLWTIESWKLTESNATCVWII